MSFKTIQNLLDEQLATVDNVPTIQTENDRYEVKVGTNFARTTLLPAQTEIASIGVHGQNRRFGSFQIDLFYSKDKGLDASGDMADAVLDAFVAGDVHTDSGTTVQVTNSYLLPARTLQSFYVKPVIVEWQSFTAR